MNAQDAVDWPRFHHQWMPDVLYLDKGISPDTIALLRGMGHEVSQLDPTSGVARVEAILSEDGWIEGATDPKGSGKAEGY
jgi:gamma-glutamyltranspeptidase/glutathione hydrolase